MMSNIKKNKTCYSQYSHFFGSFYAVGMCLLTAFIYRIILNKFRNIIARKNEQ